ncbi:hypothetical protein ACFHW0_26040 [Micromonospora sp. LOL_025]|uniref:hypothetical protein n=1 Tax=Micromonospora sp. LOL_025 TaxID=3345413 RepID=UPI003A8808D2
MREGLAAAYGSLSPAAAQVLGALAVLPTPTMPDHVPLTCAGLRPREAVGALDELVSCHLLTLVARTTPGPNRYRVHRLVAALVLDGDDSEVVPAEAVIRAAHSWGMLAAETLRRIDAPQARRDGSPVDLPDRALADPGRWLREERANLAAVLALGRARGRPELAARIAAALTWESGYPDRPGEHVDGEQSCLGHGAPPLSAAAERSGRAR